MRRAWRTVLAAALLAVAAAVPAAHAVNPDEMLSNPKLEARAEAIGRQLRCLVCRNESVEVSGSGLAHDLRVLVRQRVSAGDTDQQVIDYVHSRYGDYVLLKPPFQADTVLLWGGPLLFILLGGCGIWRYYRGRANAAGAVPLSGDERQRLDALLAVGPPREPGAAPGGQA